MQNPQARKEWMILIGAMVTNIALCGVIIWLFNLSVESPEEWGSVLAEDAMATDVPAGVETLRITETTTPMITSIPSSPSATITAGLPSPLPTLTPEPTRREPFEKTRPPYVFPTPIYIPPVPRERPTPTHAR